MGHRLKLACFAAAGIMLSGPVSNRQQAAAAPASTTATVPSEAAPAPTAPPTTKQERVDSD